MKGESFKKLSERYGISACAVETVCQREERKERLKDQRYYQIIVSLSNDEELISRIFHVIERNKLDSEEELFKVTKERLMRLRNCGKTTTELILKAVELIKEEKTTS